MRVFFGIWGLAFLAVFGSGCCAVGDEPSRRERTDHAPIARTDSGSSEIASRAPRAPAPAAQAPALAAADSTSPGTVKRRLVNVEAEDAPVRDVVDTIARQVGENIVIDDSVRARVTISLHDISWREAVLLIADRTGCEVSELRHGVLYVLDPPKVTLSVH